MRRIADPSFSTAAFKINQPSVTLPEIPPWLIFTVLLAVEDQKIEATQVISYVHHSASDGKCQPIGQACKTAAHLKDIIKSRSRIPGVCPGVTLSRSQAMFSSRVGRW